MPDDKKGENCDDILKAEKASPLLTKLGGDELVKTGEAMCRAKQDGRYGYAALMLLKADFHDIPVHQFSSGDTPKPADTPAVKTQDAKGPDSKAKGK
jgi:hypothetical protein